MVSINAQEWLDKNYSNKEELKEIKQEQKEGTIITGQLQIENFPCLEKIDVKGSWNKWENLTGLIVKNCPNLTYLDCSFNEIKEITIINCPKLKNLDCEGNQAEELARFDGSKLKYNVVSYIGSLDPELYEQLKAGLPGKKHEDIGRMCFGCLTDGGHNNKLDYGYHAEIELTKGGTIEYGVAATGNKRETCEVPKEGGLLILDINSTDGGVIKIKRRESKINKKISEKINRENFYDIDKKETEINDLKKQIFFLEKQLGEVGKTLVQTEFNLSNNQEQVKKLDEEISHFQEEKKKLEEMIQKLEDKLKQVSDEQWKKQLQEGKEDLEKKLLIIQGKLEEGERRREELQETINDCRGKLEMIQKEKNDETEEKDKKIEELQTTNNFLDQKVKELEKVIEDLQDQFNHEKLSLEQLMEDKEEEYQQQIQQLQKETARLESEKEILESLLSERKNECQRIVIQLEGKEKELQSLVGKNTKEIENLQKAKFRLEGELAAAEKGKTGLENKLTEVQKRLKDNKKKETVLLQKQVQEDMSSVSVSSGERAETEEQILKRQYPGLGKLMNEAKGKLSSENYKWLIKIFEAQEELTYLENQGNSSKKGQLNRQTSVSEVKWKLRNFQSRLRNEKLGDLLKKSKELIEKRVKSQKSSSSQTLLTVSQQVRQQRLSGGESQLKAQQQHVNLPPRK